MGANLSALKSRAPGRGDKTLARELLPFVGEGASTQPPTVEAEFILSPMAKFLFWVTRGHVLESIALSMARRPHSLKPFSPALTEVAVFSEAAFKRLRAWQAFFQGRDAAIDFAWNPVFLGLFLRDLVNYVQDPAGRYGKRATDLLFGSQPSETLLTASMLAYFPEATLLWRPLLLLMLPLLMGVSYSALSYADLSHVSVSGLKNKLEQHPFRLSTQIARFSLMHVLNWTELQVLVNSQVNVEQKREYLSEIISVAEQNKGVEGYYAIAILYRVLVTKLAGTSANSQERESIELLQGALSRIENAGGVKGFYTHYLLWLRQYGHKSSAHLHAVAVSLQSYSRLRYWLALTWAIKFGVEHLVAQGQCDQVWHYVYELNEYVCAVCPDWQQDVNVNSMTDAATCLSEYIRASDRSAEEVCAAISRFKNQFTSSATMNLDITQRWLDFPDAQWSMLRDCLQQLSAQIPLRQLNVSSNALQPIQEMGPRIAELSVLARESLDLSGRRLSPEESLNLTFSHQLQYARLADMGLQPEQVALLIARLNNTALLELDLQGNHLGAVGADALAATLPYAPVRHLALTGCDFVEENFLSLLQGLSAPHLKPT